MDASKREKRPHLGSRELCRPTLAPVAVAYDAHVGAWETTTRPDGILTCQREGKPIPPRAARDELRLLRREADDRFTATPPARSS